MNSQCQLLQNHPGDKKRKRKKETCMSTEIIQHQVVKSWATITQLPAFAAHSRCGAHYYKDRFHIHFFIHSSRI